MPGKIIVVGSINMDLVVRAPRHPEPGETILGSRFDTFPGGKGANQAVAAARLGGSVVMVGCVGEDAFGDSLLSTLQSDGVDTQFVTRTPGHSTGVALITVSEAGQNNIVVVPGANGQLSASDIQRAETAFESASAVLLQLEIPLEAVEAAVRMARKHHAAVILNPAPARPLPQELLAQIDVLIPNEQELALLTGQVVEGNAIAVLADLGLGCVIVTLGSRGALVAQGSRREHIPPHNVAVVDTTAAGDAFVGGFATALTEGRSITESARWGNAAGALAVTKAGAQPSLPKRSDVEALMGKPAALAEDMAP